MDSKHLGDSLDFMKRALLSLLSKNGFEKMLLVPMPTDNFNLSDYKEAIVPQKGCDVFCSENWKGNNNRNKYLEKLDKDIKKFALVFLDPDKGLIKKWGENTEKLRFILLDEIVEMLNAFPGVIAFYHHRQVSGLCPCKIKKIFSKCSFCAYKGGGATMFFVSNDKKSIKKISLLLKGAFQSSRVLD